jgi:hypothetical protein
VRITGNYEKEMKAMVHLTAKLSLYFFLFGGVGLNPH